jgi:orotate phosphoribosyltransferase-like protein
MVIPVDHSNRFLGRTLRSEELGHRLADFSMQFEAFKVQLSQIVSMQTAVVVDDIHGRVISMGDSITQLILAVGEQGKKAQQAEHIIQKYHSVDDILAVSDCVLVSYCSD